VVTRLKSRRERDNTDEGGGAGGPDLKTRISHTLDEMRVVLPGTQALLGFQFVAVFQSSFKDAPSWARDLHLAGLLLVCLSAAVLMAPAAYHRIVVEGRDSEAFHRFASLMLILSMGALALGISGDLVVVGYLVTNKETFALALGAIAVAVFMFLWFGFSLARRLSSGPK
jgi:hypothetical protein